MLLSFLPQLLSWLALLSTAAGAEEEGVATAPLVSAPAPAAFESDVAMAMPEALFVNRLMDGGGGGGGGDEFDSDEQLSAASGMAAAAAAVATSSTTSPSSSLLLSWSARLQRAETAPVFLSESAFSEVDATQLRLTSQVFVWMRRGGGDGEEEEEDVIEVTENYAVKGRPFVLPFATWHPAGGLTSTTGANNASRDHHLPFRDIPPPLPPDRAPLVEGSPVRAAPEPGRGPAGGPDRHLHAPDGARSRRTGQAHRPERQLRA